MTKNSLNNKCILPPKTKKTSCKAKRKENFLKVEALTSSSSFLSVITFLLFTPLCISRQSSPQIPNGTLDLSLLWYGQFTIIGSIKGLIFSSLVALYWRINLIDFWKQRKQQPYIVVRNPEVQCPGECTWPFHIANKADALVIQLGTGLADVATNPALTEFLFISEPPYNVEVNHSASVYIVDPATKCTLVFGSGAFPGFTGKIRVGPVISWTLQPFEVLDSFCLGP
ncbi:hypothetical protein Bca4012_069355 [Brassica carinata]